ncbi:MAG: RNA-guided endonuclease IscB [Moorellaceae bacterium]
MTPTFVSYPKVFVVDAEGKPLLPCHPARARKLLKVGKAEVERGYPFTIRLQYTVKNPTGVLKVKVVDGSKYVKVALVNERTGEAVFRGILFQRNNVSRLLTLRRGYRRNRRYRVVRYRECRNLNRKQTVPFPSIRQKKEAIYRVIADLAKIAPVSGVDVGLISAAVNNPPLPGRTPRQKVFSRDRVCVICGSRENLQSHHLIPKAKGGSNTPLNQILVCRECHRKLHAGTIPSPKKGVTFKWLSHAVAGKVYLLSLLSRFGEIRICDGKQAKEWRDTLGLPKRRANDAVCLFPGETLKIYGPETFIWPLRKRKWENNPTKTCDEKNGFRHWDVVRAVRAGKVVFGCVRSLKARTLTLRTAEDANFEVSYSKTKLLYRPCGIVYAPAC